MKVHTLQSVILGKITKPNCQACSQSLNLLQVVDICYEVRRTGRYAIFYVWAHQCPILWTILKDCWRNALPWRLVALLNLIYFISYLLLLTSHLKKPIEIHLNIFLVNILNSSFANICSMLERSNSPGCRCASTDNAGTPKVQCGNCFTFGSKNTQ